MRPDRLSARAPSLDDFERLVARAFDTLPSYGPPRLRRPRAGARRLPARRSARRNGIEDPYELTSLYDGNRADRTLGHAPADPPRRGLAVPPPDPRRMDRPRRVPLDRLVRHVLVHEIAHHLGWSDDDIRRVDDWTI